MGGCGSAGYWKITTRETRGACRDDGDAAVFADSTKAWWLDLVSFAPAFEARAPELRALVADNVPRRSARGANHASEERPNRFARRLRLEDGHAHAASREVIDDHGDPPAERPTLRQGKRQPRRPEPAEQLSCRDRLPERGEQVPCLSAQQFRNHSAVEPQ